MKKGFTLAETLITLGIIGIVAALTMPTLINHYQKRITENRLKVSFSIMSEAVKLSELQNDSVKYWDFEKEPKEFFDVYLKNYLKSVDGKYLSELKKQFIYIDMKGGHSSSTITSDVTYTAELTNGALILISGFKSQDFKIIAVDVNGTGNPNQLGKDLFYFAITKSKGYVPYGFGNSHINELIENYTRDDILKGNRYYCCNKNSEGHWCTALIYIDGWKIKSDYPW